MNLQKFALFLVSSMKRFIFLSRLSFVTFVPFIYVLFIHLGSPQSDLRFYYLYLSAPLVGEKKPQTIKETSRTTTSLKFVPMPVLMAKWLPHSNKVPSLNFLFVWDLRGLSLARWVNWWFQAECVYVRVCCCLSVLSLL